MTELIITEKPSTAKKIAAALGNPKTVKENGVSYFRLKKGAEDIAIVSAVGHLYTITETEKKGWDYPMFDVKWESSAKVNKESAFTAKYLNVIKKIAKDANTITIATDYDIEGEVIGHNILQFACKKKDGSRMKFSTVTKPDLLKAYETKAPTINWGLANAGLTRHELDWYYGINLSRALTSAIKKAGYFKVLSSGRVQGPALKIVVDKEKEIKAFIPEPYWQIQLLGIVNKESIEAWHKDDKIWKKDQANQILQKVKGQDGVIKAIDRSQFNQQPPFPFDLTTLQTEAYRCFKINPKDTLSLAQELYSAGVISYPRTSSQVYPPEIGYQKILQAIAKMPEYKALADAVMKGKKLTPNNGTKTDPAHPAIYPTGIHPKKVEGRYRKIFDLIIRRFLATFGEPSTRETLVITIDVNTELFLARGTLTIKKGWHDLYGPYAKFKEVELPQVKENDPVKIQDIICHDKQTDPPKRYTPASIIKDLEKRELGTKATRASIIDTLFQRGYVHSQSIEATDLGIQTVTTLEKYSPKILDEELTRHFEKEMEMIENKTKTKEEVLAEAREMLTKILLDFKTHEKEVGDGLKAATIETATKANTIGKCPKCSTGTLMIKRGKYGRFIACDQYPECKTTFKIPPTGFIKATEKLCEHCQHPLILLVKKRSGQEICINPECKGKHDANLAQVHEKLCPNCGKQMLLRKSMFGQFYGCSGYPKCKTMMKLDGTVVNGNNNAKKKAKEKKESEKKESEKKESEKKEKGKNEKKSEGKEGGEKEARAEKTEQPEKEGKPSSPAPKKKSAKKAPKKKSEKQEDAKAD